MTHAWNSYSGTPVITGNWKNSWETKDLSSIVGSQSVVVYIEVQSSFATNTGFAIRPCGDTDSYFDPTSPAGARGACSSGSKTGYSGAIFCKTDSQGRIEYRGENKVADGYLLGWFVPTDATKRDVYTGIMPVAWTSRSLPTGPDPDKNVLMFLKYKQTANTDYIAVRKEGSSEDFLPNVGTKVGGVSMAGDGVVNMANGLVCYYDSGNGPYEHISDTANGGPATVDLDLLCYEEENFVVHDQLVHTTTDASGADIDIDLSPYVGVAYALALLKVQSTGSVSSVVLSAKPRGAAQIWKQVDIGAAGNGCALGRITQDKFVFLLVPTDLAGHVELDFGQSGSATINVKLVGSISEEEVGPPVVTEPYPSGNFVSVNNPEKISFVVSNFYGVVKNTIDLKARDPIGKETQIISNGVFQGDFSGFIAEVGCICIGNNTKVYVQVDEFDELLLTREWTFIVDAENTLGVPI